MKSYYQDESGQWLVDPIVKNYVKLNKRTKLEFDNFLISQNDSEFQSLLRILSVSRKYQEAQGVTLNGIRYAGDPGNRQALQEAIAFMGDAGLTKFASWKDSDNQFQVDHPLSDVVDAYRAIGARRASLIAAEGQYADQITAGTLTNLSNVVWP